MSLPAHSAVEQLRLLERGKTSSVELVQASLDQIALHDPKVGAFLRVDAEGSLAAATEIDRRRAAGKPLGPLAGLPVAVKDILCERGERVTCASKMLRDFVAPYDATVIQRLRDAGAILIGRTNMDEFAMGGSTENSAYQKTANPWDLTRSPGGSSGGAAACLAAGMVPLSVGTDTGGSIRQPASFCGVVGIKPTYGRVSRYGLVAYASSLDQIGALARSVEDAALLLQAIGGPDPRDSTSLRRDFPPLVADLDQPLEGLRIGIAREHFVAGLDPAIEQAIRGALDVYESLGAKLVEVSLPHSRYAVSTYYVISSSEASSNLARYDGAHYGHRAPMAEVEAGLAAERKRLSEAGNQEGLDSPLVRMYRQSRGEGFGAEVKRRIMLGTYALSAGYYDAYYLKALKVRRLIRQDFDRAFDQCDILAGPVTAGPAFRLGEMVEDPLAMYLVDLYTVSANLTGIPAMSLPCGLTPGGLPIGLHLHAPPLAESQLLRAARMYEQARGEFPLPSQYAPSAKGGA